MRVDRLPIDQAAGPTDTEMVGLLASWSERGGPSSFRSVTGLSGGLYNSAFRLTADDGTLFILRVAPAEADQRPSERHLMRNEYATVPFLTPIAGLIPTVLVADFTHQIIDRDYLIQSHLPGVPARAVIKEWLPTQREHFWADLGHVLRTLHDVTSDRFGRPSQTGHSCWSQAVADTLELIAEGFRQLSLADAAPCLVADFARNRARQALDAVEVPRLLHGDLIPGNVMVDPDHPDRGIIGVFDTDRTWWGDPAADWTFVFVERLPSPEAAAFWRGYGTHFPSDEAALLRQNIYEFRNHCEALLEDVRLGRRGQLSRSASELHQEALRLLSFEI